MKGSKGKFDSIKSKGNKSACDIAYLNKWSFGSNIDSKRYVLAGNTKDKLKRYGNRYRPNDKTFGIKYQQAHKDDYKEKLKDTKILSQDFKAVMRKYANNKDTFAYLDPPYVKGGDIYKKHGVTPKEVCDIAKKSKAKVMISYDDNPLVRKSCKNLQIHRVSTKYTLSSNSNNQNAKELIITNYKT